MVVVVMIGLIELASTNKQDTINWWFNTQDAKVKLHRLYPSNQRLTEC